MQMVVVRLQQPQRNSEPKENHQDGQEDRRNHPAATEQQPEQRLDTPLCHRSSSQTMNADTTARAAYCEAITSPEGTLLPTRTTVAAGTNRPAIRTSFMADTCRPRPGARTTIAWGVSTNHVTVCSTRNASATMLITITTGEAAQFRNFWYDASPRPIEKTMIIKNTENHATKMLLSSRITNKK